MIKLSRLRTATAITAAYRGASKRDRDRELLIAQRQSLLDPSTPVKFKSAFWKNAKKQLKIEAFGKCAYCDANTEVVAHGDVEHYRPKSKYWWLAYTYDNYLFACQICNQSYKGNNFPCAGTVLNGPTVAATTTDEQIEVLVGNISPDPLETLVNYRMDQYEDSHQRERPFLLNPYLDDPTSYIAYEADDNKQEVKIIATSNAVTSYIENMEKYYGINRPELKNLRYETFRLFRTFKLTISILPDGPVKADTIKVVEDMKSDKSRFAGMIRYFNDRL